LVFDQSKVKCADNNDKKFKYDEFTKGVNNIQLFMHENVGDYYFTVSDQNWTDIDHLSNNVRGCISGSSSNSVDINGLVGCDIKTTYSSKTKKYYDLNTTFEPFSFDVDMRVINQPNQGENFLYMSNLNTSSDVAINLEGNITAKAKTGVVTTNFTDSCHARPVTFILDYTAVTDRGAFDNINPIEIQTLGESNVTVQRRVKHNSGVYSAITADALDNNITLLSSHFEDNATIEGSSKLSILYNIEKHLSETMNPVKINFQQGNVLSEDASSRIAGNLNYVPKGAKLLNGDSRFYFSRVAPDLENYPVSYELNQTTPLSIEIFCKGKTSWCVDMGIKENGLYSSHTNTGWYTAKKHSLAVDGNLTLVLDTIESSDAINSSVTPDNNGLIMNQGRIDDIITQYSGTMLDNDTTNNVVVVIIVRPKPWLKYHPDSSRNGDPFYKVTFKNGSFGVISGIGKSGNIIDIQSNTKVLHKMDW